MAGHVPDINKIPHVIRGLPWTEPGQRLFDRLIESGIIDKAEWPEWCELVQGLKDSFASVVAALKGDADGN